ncbi:MAG TPA: DUF2164 domain-containing protein [Gemmatimonadaceae bacterium]|nr:DUF2164 domain-containing protein [Gemmatimonadaceae bacterium]
MRDQTPLRLSDDARKRAIASLRQYVDRELDQEIGDLKASLLLDYILADIGPSVYNLAIADAKKFFDERASDLAALCTRDEFPYWLAQGKQRR